MDEQNHSAIVSNETGIDLLGCPPRVTSEYLFFLVCFFAAVGDRPLCSSAPSLL